MKWYLQEIKDHKIQLSIIIVSLLSIILRFMPWTNEVDTKKTLEFSGYVDIKTSGHSYFACTQDWSATEFQARNYQGNLVHGTVCCGLFFKSCTVRF